MNDADADGRRTDRRRLDGSTISSPCEPNGSGELKKSYFRFAPGKPMRVAMDTDNSAINIKCIQFSSARL